MQVDNQKTDRMALKLYVDLMSQPSRALYLFLKLTKIPCETHLVKLREGMKD